MSSLFIAVCALVYQSVLPFVSCERRELLWTCLTAVCTGGSQSRTSFMISVKLAQIWDFENVEAAYMVRKVFLQCIPFEFGREQVFQLSVQLGLLMNSCSSLAATSFLWIISETARDSSNHFCYPWLKAACQNVSSVSVVRIKVFLPTHEKLGDLKGFPSLLQDSSKKSHLWSLWPKKININQINSYLSFKWVKMLYLPFGIL